MPDSMGSIIPYDTEPLQLHSYEMRESLLGQCRKQAVEEGGGQVKTKGRVDSLDPCLRCPTRRANQVFVFAVEGWMFS